jgi:predicted RNA-binding Zn-ribbon protein involved in translation (DUF1610 family)
MAVEVTTWDWTNCYKCEVRILVDDKVVHPLCLDCGVDFDKWFNNELEKLQSR